MKIVSWNVNGLRACFRYGFLDWAEKTDADVICLQEIKCSSEQIPEELRNLDYEIIINAAEKKGYSGIAVFTREKPMKVSDKLGLARFDSEGRFLRLDFKDFILINIYLPHGGRDQSKLDYKLESYQNLLEYLKKVKDKKVILAGDLNVAHTELDLARPKQNVKNIMFTPEERKQLDMLEYDCSAAHLGGERSPYPRGERSQQLSESYGLGFTDTFRSLHPEGGHYTWWAYGGSHERNLGWRIDYIFTSKSLTPKLRNTFILPDDRGSDHCPVGIEFSGF